MFDPQGNPTRKLSFVLTIAFLVMMSAAVVVGGVTAKLRAEGEHMISRDLAKMTLIDQISRDVPVLQLHAFQYVSNQHEAGGAQKLTAIQQQLEVNTRHIEELQSMLDRDRELELFENVMRLRGEVLPELQKMMHGRQNLGQNTTAVVYGRAKQEQTDRFLRSLFELSAEIGEHTKQQGRKTLALAAAAGYLFYAFIFLALLTGGAGSWSLHRITARARRDRQLLSDETERGQIAVRKNRQFESALDNAGDIILMFDCSRRFVYANQSARTQLGYSEAEIQTLGPDSFQSPGSLMPGAQTSVKMETRYTRKDGTTFPVEIVSRQVDDGKDIVSINVARDISESKEVDRLKDEFISLVSHELRSPVTSIRGALGILASGQVGELPQFASELVSIAHCNCERLVSLINDIFELETLSAARSEFVLAPCDLRALVEDAVASSRGFANDSGVSLVGATSPFETASRVDAPRIVQMLTRLISNAVKYSAAGDTVKVEIEEQATTWRLKVVDQGTGIPDSFHDKIFSKFTQAEDVMTRGQQGAGLGLSIVKMITELHGGAVGFTSDEGRGATFFVDLPRIGRA